MYSVPPEFAERLDHEFDGRLRVRWSIPEGAFVIEQKIARGLADLFPAEEHEDAKIRLRDGYLKIMSVRNGDRMPCPRCGLTLRVPKFEIRLLECGYCKRRGYDYQHPAGFFELNDRLLEYLRSLDPKKGGSRRNRDRVDINNKKVEVAHEHEADNVLEAAVSNSFTQIAGIQSVGWTPQTG